MHVRCPHCHNPIEVVGESSLAEINCPTCGSSFSLISGDTTQTHRTASRRLAHFELVRELGIGKFGSVWMARDTKLDRTVAIKIPRKGALDSQETELFLRDARAAAQLKHPNIVGVHEVGREDGTVYIVSDYVEGANLKEWLSGQRLSFRESAHLIVKVAEALEHAHQAGVVHRDLKPGNIMVDRDGQPYVIDFGLAKRDAGEITMTVDGHILGTPAYMSPEQARGRGHQADARSDVYSLGVILFELLTGELPFRGETQMLLVQILRDEPPRPRKLNARIPRDLETITLKCLEKESAKRYQSAQQLAEDLKRWLGQQPILARPAGRAERAWRWCRRNPMVAGLSGATGLALVLGTAISGYFAIQATARAREAFEQKRLANLNAGEAKVSAEAAKDAELKAMVEKESVRRLLYASNMNLVNRSWKAGDLRRAVMLLVNSQPRSSEPDLRGWEWFYQLQLFQSELRTLSSQGAPITSIAFSPDGRLLASIGHNNLITLNDFDTGAMVGVIQIPHLTHTQGVGPDLDKSDARIDAFTHVTFNPDGDILASAAVDGTAKLWSFDTRNELRRFKKKIHLPLPSVSSTGPTAIEAFDKVDHDSVAYGNYMPGLERLMRPLGKMRRRSLANPAPAGRGSPMFPGGLIMDLSNGVNVSDTLPQDENDLESDPMTKLLRRAPIAFSLDGSLVSSGRPDGTVALMDVGSNKELRRFQAHSVGVDSLAFSPDSNRLATVGHDEPLKVWNPATGNLIRSGEAGNADVVAFSPNGRWLAAGNIDYSITIYDSEGGTRVHTLVGHTNRINDVAFSPDGERLASAGREMAIKVWDVNTGAELRTFKGHTGAVTRVTFSPDGRSLASAGDDGSLKLWDVGTDPEVRTIHVGRALTAAMSDDGRLLATGDVHGKVQITDIATRTTLLTFQAHKHNVNKIAFSPDGQRLATTARREPAGIWNANTGKKIGSFGEHKASIVKFHPDGHWLVTYGEDSALRIWDRDAGAELRSLPYQPELRCISFSPDGQRLITIDANHTIKVLDSPTGEELETFEIDAGLVSDIALSPDGQRLATASTDGTVRLLDLTNGAEVLTLACPRVPRTVSLTRDGTRLAVIAGDSIRVYDARSFTPDEKMGQFLARGILEHHRTLDDALAEIAKKTHWNEAMREATRKYIKGALHVPASTVGSSIEIN